MLFKLDPLIMFFTALSERVLLPGLLLAGGMLLLTLVFGRFFCGWICPMGTMIDITRKLRFRRRQRPLKDGQNQKARKPKFFILAFIFFLALGGVQAAWLLDPIVIIARVVSLSFIPAVTLTLNNLCIFLIQRFELYGGFYDFYRGLKDSFLGVNVHFFANSLITFLFFAIICLASVFLSRVWCRSVCPLGALYSLVARFSFLKRFISDCKNCGICRRECRMGAIKEDNQYVQGECILCMDCVYHCTKGQTYFAFKERGARSILQETERAGRSGMTRRDFLFWVLLSVPVAGLGRVFLKALKRDAGVLRPPGALPEERFVDTCVRCGNCMKVCITNGLQPIFMQEGIEGLWSPQLVPEIGYCEYNCTLCGNVCPTGALNALSLQEKKQAKIGVARIDRTLCLPWADQENCLVCEEHCPVAEKAIKVRVMTIDGKEILRPYVDEDLCVGCGICQNKCPVRPQRAIRVYPLGS